MLFESTLEPLLAADKTNYAAHLDQEILGIISITYNTKSHHFIM